MKNISEDLTAKGVISETDGDKAELDSFRREKAVRENLSRELEEFSTLFPDTKIEDIPDEVWDAYEDGRGICAHFALFLYKKGREKESAEAKNAENTASAVPNVEGEEEVYFTPEAVRKMSKAEVDKNYSAILESMKRWK